MTSEPITEDFEDDDAEPSSQNGVISGHCVSDMWLKGWTSVEKMNVGTTRMKQRERLNRKKKVQRVILRRVEELKASASDVIVDQEAPAELGSRHSDYLRSLDSNRYKD